MGRYLTEIVPQKKGIKQAAGIVRAWQRSPLARKTLAAIRSTDLAAWRDAKLKEVGPQTVIHHLNLLSHVYRIAATDWGMESLANPVTKIKKPPPPKGRERRLLNGEEQRLLDACDQSQREWLGPAVRLALATAMREGELVGLSWSQVRFPNRTILLPDTKNGDARTVPLSSVAIQVLQCLGTSANVGRVFPIMTGRAISHAFSKVCKQVGIMI